jgi:NADP-dependent 3-hydroxy acid dehydrogenase YdfG
MKTPMIWGSAGGIGKAILEHLVQERWRTIAVTRDSSELSNLAEKILETYHHNHKGHLDLF